GQYIAEALSEEVVNRSNTEGGNAWERFTGGIWTRLLGILASMIFGSRAKEITEAHSESLDRIRSGDFNIPEITVPDVSISGEDGEVGTQAPLEGDDIITLPEEARYNAGLDLIFHFGNISLPTNERDLLTRAYRNIRDITFTELASISTPADKTRIFGDVYDTNPVYRGIAERILESTRSRNTQDVITLSLTPERTQRLLQKSRIRTFIGEQRSNEILTSIESGNFSYTQLTYREISYLYTSTFPLSAFRINNENGLPEFENDDFEGLISPSILAAIQREYRDIDTLGGRTILDNDNYRTQVESHLETPEEREEFASLWEFKNYILSPEFLDHTFLDFSAQEKQAFDSALHMRHIALLYNMMGGARLGENLGPGSVGILLYIPHVLRGNRELAEGYQTKTHRRLGQAAFRNNLSPEEERAFELYFWPFLESWVDRYINTITLRYRYGRDILGVNNLVGAAGGGVLMFSGKNLILSGVNRNGLTRFGLTRISFGATIWSIGAYILFSALSLTGRDIYKYFNEDGSRTDEPLPLELQNFERDNYPGSIMDRDLEEAEDIWTQAEVIARMEDSTHNYEVNGEPLVVVSYPGQDPFIMYQGKLWAFASLSDAEINGDILGSIIENINPNREVHTNTVWSGFDGSHIAIGESGNTSIRINYGDIFGEDNISFETIELRDIGAIFQDSFPGSGIDGERLEVLRIYGGAETQLPGSNLVLVPYALTGAEEDPQS
ncbi:hypothetical protein LAT59_02625, partial [Candidatus Gracilibacteria bacterium]|nr:hypothetical protein [Candidatus Gracilibacteria bacterium]